MVKSSILEELLVMKTFLNDKLDRDHLFSKFFSIKSICKSVNLFISSFALKRNFSLNRVKYFKALWNF